MKKALIALIIILIALQFIRPDINVSGYESLAAFEQETRMPTQIKSIMQKNCYDCHSQQTSYPWYAQVAPISLWLNHHIEEGQEHLNLAEWSSWDFKKKDHKIEEIIEEVAEGEMPLKSYTWMHGSLSEADKEQLINWAKKAKTALKTRLATNR